MCSGNLIKITVDILAVDILEQQLRNALCLILDCRPFLAYNESHILNSINIHCPPILRRRKNGYLPLRTIIPDVLTRERLSSKYFHTVILYDEFAFNDNDKSDDSMINLVAKCLQQEADLKNVYVLDGGIQKFRQAYPQLCTNKEALRNGNLNKSPISGNLTWPLKSNNSNGLTLPNCNGLKICCNSVASSQSYLSGSSKYQILINNNSKNCAKAANHQLNCNNNVLISNKNYINSSTEDNNENILNNGVNFKLNNKQSIDTVDCPLINHSNNHLNNHQTTTQSFQSINHSTHFNLNTSSSLNHHYEQSATNQQQFNQLINTNGLSGSCSQLNNYSTSNTNLMTNHSMSLSNLTNLSTVSTKYNSLSNFQQQQINQQCSCCLENNNNLINENRSWIPKFNSFGNDASEPVEILPHLLLGSELHASQLEMLKRIGVTALLNVSHSCPNHFEKDFVYKCIPVQDSSFEDISVYFDDAIQFIDQIKANNGRVLVHCHAGISRSATICMAYIMSNMKLRMEDAYEFVKNRRRIVSPNFNFMGQLLSFESIVFAAAESTNKSIIDDQMDIDLTKNLNTNLNNNLTSTKMSPECSINAIVIDNRNSNLNNSNNFTDSTNSSTKLKNIFDFSNCNNAPDLSIKKLDFSSIKKLNNANIATPLLSPT